jgi:hypothetical protein
MDEEEKVPKKRSKKSKDPLNLEGKQPPDKYYKKFDFFYKRTCFRLMAEFFKRLF